MTRQEYQNSYGKAPSVSSQPIKMTRQQYDQKYGSGVEKPKTIGGFASNVVSSGANAVGGIVSSVLNVANPDMQKNTVANLAKLSKGAVQLADPTKDNKIADRISGIIPGAKKITDFLAPGNQEETARNVGKFYDQRYGVSDAFKGDFKGAKQKIVNTAYNDPVGTAMDISSVIGGAGALARGAGAASKVAGLSRVGQTLEKVSRFADPLQVAGMGLGKAGSKFSSFARGTARVAENADDIERLKSIFAKNNVELPASATTNNQFVRQAEALTAKGPLGSKVDARFQASSQLPKTLLQDVTDANVSDVAAVRNSLGESVRGDLKKYATGFKKQANTIYDDLEKTLGDTPVKPVKTQQMIDKLYNEQKMSALPQVGGQKLLEDLYLNLENTDTYAALNQTRKDIYNRINSNDPVASGSEAQLKAIYSATESDLNNVADAANPDIAAALKTKAKIGGKWNEFKKLMNRQEGKNITSDLTDIEDIVPRIYKPNNASSINRLKQFANPATFKELGDTLITQIVNSSVNQRTGLIDPLKWKNVLAKWDTPTLRAALGDDGLARIETLSKTIDDAGFSQNMITNSTKAYAGSQTAMLGSAAVGGSTLVGSILTLNPAPILTYLGVNLIGKALFESNAGRSLVSGAFKMPKTPGLSKFGSGAKSVFSKSYNLGKAGRIILPKSTQEEESRQLSYQPLSKSNQETLSYPPIIPPIPPVRPQKLKPLKYKSPDLQLKR